MTARYVYLIIGGGMTADAAVRGIRELDRDGAIGIVGDEPHPPYGRPPLSKALWKGESESSIWRGTAEAGVTLHLGRRAVALDVAGRTVTDDAGDGYRFEKLLLATGGTARRLPFGGELIIPFRTLDDYRRVRALANEGRSFAVIGGGFIGSEISAALAGGGNAVTMLFPEAGIGARTFPADLSSFLVEYYRAKGVDVRPGESAAGVSGRGGKTVIRTTQGRELRVDAVVAGVGITPNTELAEAAGLLVSDGIVTDPYLRASSPHVFAAGDVARFHSPALGCLIRVEHEDNALAMGRAAGRAMAGDPAPYTHLPFFYSDLFELGYEAVGELDARAEVVADWKVPFREGSLYYLKEGRVRGMLLWGVFGQVDAARRLIAEPGPFTAQSLRNRLSD